MPLEDAYYVGQTIGCARVVGTRGTEWRFTRAPLHVEWLKRRLSCLRPYGRVCSRHHPPPSLSQCRWGENRLTIREKILTPLTRIGKCERMCAGMKPTWDMPIDACRGGRTMPRATMGVLVQSRSSSVVPFREGPMAKWSSEHNWGCLISLARLVCGGHEDRIFNRKTPSSLTTLSLTPRMMGFALVDNSPEGSAAPTLSSQALLGWAELLCGVQGINTTRPSACIRPLVPPAVWSTQGTPPTPCLRCQ